MNSIFILLLVLSFVALVIGTIKPTLLKLASRLQVLKIFTPALVVLFILVGVTMDKKPAEVKVMTTEEKVRSAIDDVNLVELSFGSLQKQEEKTSGAENVTVKITVKNIYSKEQFFKQTGKLNAKIYQALFSESDKIAVVSIQFEGEKVDQFGKTTLGNFMVQTLSKFTYDKIVWENFDTTNLCDFLRRNNVDDRGEIVNACAVFVGDLR